jgi:hypothetical protein
MNLEALYHRLIEDRRTNPPVGYSERHHIIPRCDGGSDDPQNLVRLSARDHLFAHLILAKWKGGLHWGTVIMMLGQKKTTARKIRLTALDRERAAQAMGDRLIGNQFKKGKPQPQEAVARLRQVLRGNQNRKGIPHSEEVKARIRASCKGQPKSEETKARMRAAWARRRQASL